MLLTLNEAPSGCDVWVGSVRFAAAGLMQFVEDISINRNVDKTGNRGRRKTKPNHCKIQIDNWRGTFNDLKHAGRKITVVSRLRSAGLVSVGTYVLEEDSYDDGARDTLLLDGKGHEILLAEDFRPRVWRKKTPSELVREIAAERGWRVRVTDILDRDDFAKPATQSVDSYLEDLAWDLGCDYWVDDCDIVPTLCFVAPEDRPLLSVGWNDAVLAPKVTIGQGLDSPASLLAATMKHSYRHPTTEVGGRKRKRNGETAAVPTAGGGAFKIPVGGNFASKETLALVSQHTPDGQEGRRAERIADGTTRERVTVTWPFPFPWLRENQSLSIAGKGARDGAFQVIDIEWKPLGGPTTVTGRIGAGALSTKRQKKGAPTGIPTADGGAWKIYTQATAGQ